MNTATAETPDQQKITAEMVESYLDQALANFSDQKIQRYEKNYLETASHRSRYPELKGKKEYLKAALMQAYIDPKDQKIYQEAFERNIERYQKLTGLNIRIVTKPEKNIYFQLVITTTNIADVTSHKNFKNYFYDASLTPKELQKQISEQRETNYSTISRQFLRRPEKSINLTISIINAKHSSIKPGKETSSIILQMDRLFLDAFANLPNIENLPSIKNIKAHAKGYYNEIQPLDKAFLKALYSTDIHSGMDTNQAKPLLKKHILNELHLK